jgi:hypothetical protein
MTLQETFLDQARACTQLGSPFMGQLLTGLSRTWRPQTALGQKLAEWTGDIGPGGASLPLRIAGGLHALVLTGQDKALKAVYPPQSVDDATLTAQVHAALDRNEAFMLDWITSPPQTNEVRRSGALIPVAHWIAARHPLPFMTSELGASAGLNLCWDRFALDVADKRLGPENAPLTLTPDWDGALPTAAQVNVVNRRGVDLNPIDATQPDAALRLMAYLWPDQPHRHALTRAAISAHDGIVDQGDAIDWLEHRLPQQPDGQIHMIYHTIAWQYFPAEAQARGTAMIEAAGAVATESKPLAWVRMENDGQLSGAGLSLRLWPGDHHIDLGRADFHGRWVNWTAPSG